MRTMMKLKDAAKAVGLPEWELRTGFLSGKYPGMRVGGPHGKIIFDIGLLNQRIGELMEANVKQQDGSPVRRIG